MIPNVRGTVDARSTDQVYRDTFCVACAYSEFCSQDLFEELKEGSLKTLKCKFFSREGIMSALVETGTVMG